MSSDPAIPLIALDRLATIILLGRSYSALTLESDPDEGSNPADDRSVSALELQSDNPFEQELRTAMEGLPEEESWALVALFWIGRGDFEATDYDQALVKAREAFAGGVVAPYLAGQPLLGDLLEDGAEACGLSMTAPVADVMSHSTRRGRD
jgi:hypothetical protein